MNSEKRKFGALQDLGASDLRGRWRRLFRSEPPAGMSRDLLIREIAYRVQAQAHGGLTPTTRRRLRTLARQLEGTSVVNDRTVALKPGARLVREWGGQTHHVMAIEDGFDYEGKRYRSLTAVASAITGTHWSGPRFFGLKRTRASFATEGRDDG
jgi:hypothetical protein